jgi:Uma2 family endonuclease
MMAGGTYNHSVIKVNLISSLNRVKPPCQTLDSDMRLYVRSTRQTYYPDAMVVCGERQFHDEGPAYSTLLNPKVVFEVLSPSTQHIDRGQKLDDYTTIDSVEAYLIVASEERRVQQFLRQDNGDWLMQTLDGPDAVAQVTPLDLALPLAALYRGLTFAANAAG